jgi:hypothetical protein
MRSSADASPMLSSMHARLGADGDRYSLTAQWTSTTCSLPVFRRTHRGSSFSTQNLFRYVCNTLVILKYFRHATDLPSPDDQPT